MATEVHPKRIIDAGLAKVFLMGGNARFTLVSRKSGKRFTYRVKRKDEGVYFVHILTGSNNETDYNYMGTIFSGRAPYRHGRKSNIKETAPSVVAFNWVWRHLMEGNLNPDVEFWHEGRCCRCARPLTDPVSIERGIGPECARHA